MSLGRGTVDKLHGCLYVPDLQKNLISVLHVCKDLGGYFIMDDSKCQFVDMKRQRIILNCPLTSDLYSTMDLTWLGIYSATLAPKSIITRERSEAIVNYIDGIHAEAMMVQQATMENAQRRCLPAEEQHLLHELYVTKADASYNLHAPLGHMPYF